MQKAVVQNGKASPGIEKKQDLVVQQHNPVIVQVSLLPRYSGRVGIRVTLLKI